MHEVATSVPPTVVILIGILFGIFYNQRGLDKLETRLDARIDRLETRIDRLESRIDRLEARMDEMRNDMLEFYRMLSKHDEAIETLKKRS